MRKILRIQILKLFNDIEYIGYSIIGSFLVLVFGWGYNAVFLENQTESFQNTMTLMLKFTFPALIVLTICLFGYTFIREFQNKTLYYEKMHEVKLAQMIIGRFIVPLMNSCMFCIVLLGVQIVFAKLYNYLNNDFIVMVLEKTFFSFIIVLHFNIVVGIYFFVFRNVVGGGVFTALLQWFIPSILASNISIGDFDMKLLLDFFCCSQFVSIWESNNINSFLIYQIVVSFFGECIVLYLIVFWYYQRKDWN